MAVEAKVVLLGQENAGKTCLVDRFIRGQFQSSASSTVGAAYAAKRVKTEAAEVVVSLWDTAGAERFESLSRLYFSGAQAALVCIDLTDPASLQKTQFWVKELKEHQPECRCYLVLCKCDLLETPPKELPPPRPASPGEAGERGGGGGADSPPFPPIKAERNVRAEPAPEAGSASPRDQDGFKEQPPPSPTRPKLVSDAQLRALAASAGAKIAATSAQTGQGVRELFEMVAADLAADGLVSRPPAPGLLLRGDSLRSTAAATPRLTSAPGTARQAGARLSRQGSRASLNRGAGGSCCVG